MTLDSGGTTILSFRGGAQEYQWGNSAQIRVAFQKRLPSWIDTDTFGFALVAGEAAKAKSSLGSDALRLLDPGLGRGVDGCLFERSRCRRYVHRLFRECVSPHRSELEDRGLK